jgi:hypothetical protein
LAADTFAPIYMFGERTGSNLPPPQVDALSTREQSLITLLHNRMSVNKAKYDRLENYYYGKNTWYNLNIGIPDTLAGVSTVVDWPRICCDPLVQRCIVDGFRLPDASDVDEDMQIIWQDNSMDVESPLAFLDSLITGTGYLCAGTNDDGSPLITVESPLNVAMNWDVQRNAPGSVLQYFQVDGQGKAVLYLPGVSTYLIQNVVTRSWDIEYRDVHNMPIPVVRLPNRARSRIRHGTSEITKAVQDTTDSTMRTMLGMEIAREFYSIPHRWVLGADESDFINKDGTPKTALQMSMSKFIGFNRNEDGELPTVGQFNAYDPTVFTKVVELNATLMASYTQFPPAWFGHVTRSAPASAEAMKVNEDGADRRAGECRRQWSGPLVDIMLMARRIANGGAENPPEFERMQVDWKDTSLVSDAAVSDAITKQIAAQVVPPQSDVVLKQLGYSSVERDQIREDMKAHEAQQALQDIAANRANPPVPGQPGRPAQPKPFQPVSNGNAAPAAK